MPFFLARGLGLRAAPLGTVVTDERFGEAALCDRLAAFVVGLDLLDALRFADFDVLLVLMRFPLFVSRP